MDKKDEKAIDKKDEKKPKQDLFPNFLKDFSDKKSLLGYDLCFTSKSSNVISLRISCVDIENKNSIELYNSIQKELGSIIIPFSNIVPHTSTRIKLQHRNECQKIYEEREKEAQKQLKAVLDLISDSDLLDFNETDEDGEETISSNVTFESCAKPEWFEEYLKGYYSCSCYNIEKDKHSELFSLLSPKTTPWSEGPTGCQGDMGPPG